MEDASFPPSALRPRLLVLELWGLGDVALTLPFLREAATHCAVTLIAKPHAAPLLERFCPEVELLPFTAPWTAFRHKYRLCRWPWAEFFALLKSLQGRRFAAAVSARPDPRDHLFMALTGASMRVGFPRAGSRLLITDALMPPTRPHRFASWQRVAGAFGWNLSTATPAARHGRRIVVHTGAAQPTRQWARGHFEEITRRLAALGWEIDLLDEKSGSLPQLLDTLSRAHRFIGNDSGPGHVAALLGLPTFTIFGAQLPENFHPLHPQAAWIEGKPCAYKPCHDSCRFPEPHCIRGIGLEDAYRRILAWLG